ncbi:MULTISPECIES: hypothetical protein [unclassified Paenibacillus]|nr:MULTISPECIES: hypothetical protein [unclassified Paenibacillus]MDF9843090.1 hypothetical protein [Paenibacillus sp. PastF-2]MDF9849698.1 hypothetical protein [Paenibacillus sp. PastM-2]MDH6481656.1 hypothetical protein [Paenibacillus sp. PastH-2]
MDWLPSNKYNIVAFRPLLFRLPGGFSSSAVLFAIKKAASAFEQDTA